MTNALENLERLDMSEDQDFATLRALYEYAIEHYSAGSAHDASALFEIIKRDFCCKVMRRLCSAMDGDIRFIFFIKLQHLLTVADVNIKMFVLEIFY